jgi:2-methylfumaryl-CoA hydratase
MSEDNGLGRFFEDFRLGETIRHATPRTLSAGDAALHIALTGSRFAVTSSAEFARAVGYKAQPLDDLLVFNMVFGKTVPDISLNAVANLGYADCRFLKPVSAGDTLMAASEVIGLKENSNRQTGVVHVRSTGVTSTGEPALTFIRWVMVRKRDAAAAVAKAQVPDLPARVEPAGLGEACPEIDLARWDDALAGSVLRFEDYKAGDRIDHVDGMTVEEAEHMLATRLYQNTARVHFNALSEAKGRFGRRLVYGGHVMSLARALSFNGLANAFHIAAINGGRHAAPLFAGGTVFAWSEILGAAEIPGRSDVGCLRIMTRASRDLPCGDFPRAPAEGDQPGIILELDYWALIPRRMAA